MLRLEGAPPTNSFCKLSQGAQPSHVHAAPVVSRQAKDLGGWQDDECDMAKVNTVVLPS